MPSARPRTIVAVTGEDDRYATVRQRAAALVASSGGTVLLYDLDAAGVLASPTPTEWSADGQEQFDGRRLGPEELEAQGRAAIAEQVRILRADGLDAWGYLPSSSDGEDLARYAESQRADVIFVPAELEEPGLLDRLTGGDPAGAARETAIPVVPVAD